MKLQFSQPECDSFGAESPQSAALAVQFERARAQTERLARRLSAEDSALQSMPDASPVKWHLAHTTWFFETFILEQAVPGYRPFHPQFRVLFNSYYVAVGPRHPRPERGLLSPPPARRSPRLPAPRRRADDPVAGGTCVVAGVARTGRTWDSS